MSNISDYENKRFSPWHRPSLTGSAKYLTVLQVNKEVKILKVYGGDGLSDNLYKMSSLFFDGQNKKLEIKVNDWLWCDEELWTILCFARVLIKKNGAKLTIFGALTRLYDQRKVVLILLDDNFGASFLWPWETLVRPVEPEARYLGPNACIRTIKPLGISWYYTGISLKYPGHQLPKFWWSAEHQQALIANDYSGLTYCVWEQVITIYLREYRKGQFFPANKAEIKEKLVLKMNELSGPGEDLLCDLDRLTPFVAFDPVTCDNRQVRVADTASRKNGANIKWYLPGQPVDAKAPILFALDNMPNNLCWDFAN